MTDNETAVAATDDTTADPGITLKNVYLQAVAFERHPDPSQPGMGDFDLELEIARALDGLLVGLVVAARDSAMNARLTYRVEFTLTKEFEDPGERESFLRLAAARIAPLVLYPYARETLAALTTRAGLKQALLPVLNVGGMWDPDEIEIPDLEENAESDD